MFALGKQLAIYTRFLFALILLGSFLFAVLGLGHAGISIDTDGKMVMENCPFMPSMSICPMTLFEHLGSWQSMFVATASDARPIVLLVLLATLFVAFATRKHGLFLLSYRNVVRWRLYIRHNPEFSLFNFLREVLSRGILNPKTH